MEFLNEYHLAGLFIGICTFLIIGLFHPVVVKAEYYWGTKCWWIFLILGIGGVIASLSIDNVILSSLLGVFAFSSFWTIKEMPGSWQQLPRFQCLLRRRGSSQEEGRIRRLWRFPEGEGCLRRG